MTSSTATATAPAPATSGGRRNGHLQRELVQARPDRGDLGQEVHLLQPPVQR